ncbi:hypothetical protein F442_02079 [Phytophthora nicotianae P10297]|uniref:DOT1 domain-containing protein n=1 Tax=Phytophthora nicotianae P10297 TaxID=1317064 RepID=W3A1B4_PHYNI|nr:hypothetical protein F442_02079 [Phytophthora nicotianae P10297]
MNGEDAIRAVDSLFASVKNADIRQKLGKPHTNAGEIFPAGVDSLINSIGDIDDQDIFLDVGCGLGNVLVQFALQTLVSKCYGIERPVPYSWHLSDLTSLRKDRACRSSLNLLRGITSSRSTPTDPKKIPSSACLPQAPLLFQLRWLDSQFQKHAESITVDLVQKGHHNYNLVTRELNQIGWRSLCEQADDNDIVIDGSLEDLEEEYVRFEPSQFQPTNLREVDAIQNMHFDPNAQLEQPMDLFKQPDGSTSSVVKQEFRHLFEHSASSSSSRICRCPFGAK